MLTVRVLEIAVISLLALCVGAATSLLVAVLLKRPFIRLPTKSHAFEVTMNVTIALALAGIPLKVWCAQYGDTPIFWCIAAPWMLACAICVFAGIRVERRSAPKAA